jgi:transcriptional regulator with XRE-family HTH domain
MSARRDGLAARRKALGYSQEAFAELLRVDRSTVARWERGESEPQPYLRPKIVVLLQINPRRLAELLAPAAPIATQQVVSDHEAHSNAVDLRTSEPDDMNRRELLRLLTITGALVTLPHLDNSFVIEQPDSDALDEYKLLNTHLWQAFSLSKSKRAVYPLVQHHLSLLTTGLNQSHSASTHKRLCVLVADLSQLAGEIFFDANRYTDAAHCYAVAATASKEAGAYDLWACALTRHAFISMYERRFKDAGPLLAVAVEVAKKGDSQLSTRQWVAVVQAQAYAGIGDLDGCKRALDAAETVRTLTGPVGNGGWLRFDGTRLAEERGTCFVELGRLDLAEVALADALKQKLSARRRGSVLTDLALLGAKRSDLDEVYQYGNAAVELAQQTGSGYVGRRLQGLQAQLATHATDRRISQLNDQIAGLSSNAR